MKLQLSSGFGGRPWGDRVVFGEIRPVRDFIALIVGLCTACGAITHASAQQAQGPTVSAAKTLLTNAREGRLPEAVEVVLNAGQAEKLLGPDDTASLLKDCVEGPLVSNPIYDQSGSVPGGQVTFVTSFTCNGRFEDFTGAVGVVLFEDGALVRLIIQVDGYAAAYPRKQRN